MKEQDIIYEQGSYWVLRDRKRHLVMKNVGTHAESDSSYCGGEEGRLLAVARCSYLADREQKQ